MNAKCTAVLRQYYWKYENIHVAFINIHYVLYMYEVNANIYIKNIKLKFSQTKNSARFL